MSVEKILEIQELTKVYGDFKAVNGISFSIGAGEVVGLLGPNGAGKTSTISMVLGLLKPTSGIVKIFGKEFGRHRREILSKVNFAAVYAHLPGNLTVWQNLNIFSRLYQVKNHQEKVQELIKDFDLEEFSKVRVGLLSSGEQTRVGLAKALLNDPQLLLLDEPTASLDPSSSDLIRTRIKNYVKMAQAAALWTSHDMYEIEAVCDRVLFISHGKILLDGKPRELPQQYGKKNLEELFIAVAREPLSLK